MRVSASNECYNGMRVSNGRIIEYFAFQDIWVNVGQRLECERWIENEFLWWLNYIYLFHIHWRMFVSLLMSFVKEVWLHKLKYLLHLKFYVHVYLSLCRYVHMHVGIPQDQRMSCGSLDLGSQVFVSYSTWVLGTRLMSSVRSVYTLNHWNILQLHVC